MTEMLENILTEIGLSPNESIVYNLLIQEGPDTILRVSRKTDIKRPTVYNIMNSLQKKGLVYLQMHGTKKYFHPENPERLQQILVSKGNLLTEILPELSAAFFNIKRDDQMIRHYMGREGIRAIGEELLQNFKKGDDYLVTSNMENWIDAVGQKFDDYYFNSRKKIGVKSRFIVQKTEFGIKYKNEINDYDDVRFLPKEFELATELLVTNNRVVIYIYKEPYMALSIENESVHKTFYELFNVLWKASEK